MNARLSKIARRLQRMIVRGVMAVTPKRPHLVINGFPVDEGNAVEMLRASAERYPGTVYWLVPDVEEAYGVLEASGADPERRVEVVPHRSLTGLWRFATAEVSMFTHGLFGNPGRVPRKTMVNLWHGGGFKGNIMSDERGRPTISSDYLVASTQKYGAARARECRLPAGGLLVTGNPRIDQFARSESAALDRLGIDRARPFVLWMPTFRRNKGRGLTAGWSDVADGPTVDVNAVMAGCVELLAREYGLAVVVKPHPQDGESRSIPGAVVVTNERLREAGVQLYELIGEASGLLTDYSSVWIDYLALDRPIAFVVPDEAGYAAGRGFDPPDALDWLPGPKITDETAVRAFAEDVLAGGRASADRRREVAREIGHVGGPGVAHRILDELQARGVFARPIRPRASTGVVGGS
ncbi:CDP-glycerol glycerophosphotransferase, TagB/SpsB family [Agromyces sp. CF514]|uniref:CDP-glycerol glycerophosphotransferase family protein n=1 Tax=Agromyces sp. CF514 TaxID=1881031 RepID=UPI0008EEA5F6|nr:CDP-glycerol glycerophosphotransferase family protein [Agromyces sp. CF514]SFR84120.1 CDP-glycerol glycerophosphotransferase, TagB/SpsB family [Agromyces sp. CF514]